MYSKNVNILFTVGRDTTTNFVAVRKQPATISAISQFTKIQ